MQVQQYKEAPIGFKTTFGVNQNHSVQLIESAEKSVQTIKQILNSTFEVVNQTINQVIIKNQPEYQMQSSEELSFEDEWNFLYFLRLLFYIIVILKVLDLVFNRRKKMDIKQRVYRKYLFSHGQMLRQFDQDDRKVMETTLNNTIKNACIDKFATKLTKKSSNKTVCFFQNKNTYHEPLKLSHQNENNINLQQFLKRSAQFSGIYQVKQIAEPVINLQQMVKISQMKKQIIEDEPDQRQFQVIEIIKQKTVNGQREYEIVVQKGTQSYITQSTQSSEIFSNFGSEIRQNNNQNLQKEKEKVF